MPGNEHSGRSPGVPRREVVHTSITLSWREHRVLSDYVMQHRPLHLNDLFVRWVRDGMRRAKITVPKE